MRCVCCVVLKTIYYNQEKIDSHNRFNQSHNLSVNDNSSVKPLLFTDKCINLNNLSVETRPFTDKLHFSSQLFSEISYSYLQHDISRTQKTEQPAVEQMNESVDL